MNTFLDFSSCCLLSCIISCNCITVSFKSKGFTFTCEIHLFIIFFAITSHSDVFSCLNIGSLFYVSWMLKKWTSPVPEMSESHESPLKWNVLHTFAGNFREFMGTHAGTSGLSGSKFHSKSPFCSKFSFSPAF